MLHGIGTDLLAMSRVKTMENDRSFLKRVFTADEREQAQQREDPLRYYATRFSGKEAVFKALRTDPDSLDMRDIEILADENGAPCVTLHGELRSMADAMGVGEIKISVTWESDYVLTFAMALMY